MSSYDTIVTRADFVPTVVGQQADRSVSSATSAHNGTSQQPRPGVQQTQLNVLSNHSLLMGAPDTNFAAGN